ncbi:Hint domain-containing protein [Tropicibacter sp. R15_0]|uniref:Hint domain-containing protein n=1 Tax=Tropicibacter sp. R15_0 TaxID=2821101 RepID=UPI001ADC0D91|nr:Hint domain-containing protein [Tropicibacter sp. R15_0]MBO9465083.1 Hint domain-containing protein [Tropicibacter sp. R15_0]
MATYTVTTSNWNSPAYWAGISEVGPGHELDFSGLPSSYSVTVDYTTAVITIFDGTTSFTIGEPGDATTDANFGGSTQLDYFNDINGSAGQDTVDASSQTSGVDISGGGGADAIAGGSGNDTIIFGSGDDTVLAGAGYDYIDDTGGFQENGANLLDGGADNDTIYAGQGDDSIYGGTGSDQLFGEDDADVFYVEDSFGNDTIFGGEGGTDDDTIDASAVTSGITVQLSGSETGTLTDGTDTISFSEIESFLLTDQADSLDASSDSSGLSVEAGAGDDTIHGGTGGDTIVGGGDDDSIFGGVGQDTIFGGSGADTIDGGDGHDVASYWFSVSVNIDLTDGSPESGGEAQGDVITNIEEIDGSNTGDDTITVNDQVQYVWGYGGNDSLTGSGTAQGLGGGTGDDTIDGGGGNDTLWGGSGNDTIIGGDGDDNITGGTGNDSLTGGLGNDTFVYSVGDGLDTISDFNAGNTGTLSDGDNTNNDFIDLSAFYDNIAELQDDYADDGILNQSNAGNTVWGQTIDYSDNTSFDTDATPDNEGIVFTGQSADGSSFTQENTGVICFATGSIINTPRGSIPIERLTPGDTVTTRDNGPQPIIWVGSRTLAPRQLEQMPSLKPIRLSARFFDLERDLIVSPQHGILLRAADRGGTETLFRARHLAELEGGGARVLIGCRKITYHHLMFASHQVINANGMWSESLYPGKMALAAMPKTAVQEIMHLFPGLKSHSVARSYGAPTTTYSQRRRLPDTLRELVRIG